MNATPPLVTIITPVYNGEKYLAQCIESVLNQTYSNWEYIIANNRSTDSTLEIATRYAASDRRIRVHNFERFVSVIENHNRSLRLGSANSKYCKVIPADDWLLPECIERMVALAETNPSVGIVGSYTLRGNENKWRIVFDGLPYSRMVVPGREACRWHLLGGHHYLGCQTSVLYRADLTRKRKNFYPNLREHADITVFYECLFDTDLGFVHLPLTCERVHDEALGAVARRDSTIRGSHLIDLIEYGSKYLTPEEIKTRMEIVLREYYDVLATGIVNFRGKRYWSYHKAVLKQCGFPFLGSRLAMAMMAKVADLVFNPKMTIERILRRLNTD
jgi:glycosyltransferase involved in cell wall biosynthesis